MLIVNIERNRYLQARSDQTHAELVLPSQAPREQSLQRLWKEYAIHDADNEVIGKRREVASKITVIQVEGPVFVADLTLDVAQKCGFKTSQGLQEDWYGIHPRSMETKIVWFVLGDWRDQDRYLAWTGVRAGADEHGYTVSRTRAMDDAPVPDEVLAGYSFSAHQKDDARRGEESLALATETAANRLLRLLEYVEYVKRTEGEVAARYVYGSIRQHLRVITQRLNRAERRKDDIEEQLLLP